jgi:hypothetical protein
VGLSLFFYLAVAGQRNSKLSSLLIFLEQSGRGAAQGLFVFAGTSF